MDLLIISKSALLIGRIDGYFSRYFELCITAASYRIAWELVEEEHFLLFGFYRYKTYGYFRQVKSKRYGKRQKPTQKTQLF